MQLLRRLALAAILLVACREDPSGDGGGGQSSQGGGSALGGGGAAGAGGTVLGGGGAGGSGGSGDPADLTLMAWNLETFPLTSGTIPAVQSVLADLQPDVVGLEELHADADFQNLVGGLDGYGGIIAMVGDGFSRV